MSKNKYATNLITLLLDQPSYTVISDVKEKCLETDKGQLACKRPTL